MGFGRTRSATGLCDWIGKGATVPVGSSSSVVFSLVVLKPYHTLESPVPPEHVLG